MATEMQTKKVKCWGEAHSNPYIDHCPICEPHWSYLMMTPKEIEEVEKNWSIKLEILNEEAN